KPLCEYISEGQPITFPTSEGHAYAFYYPPKNTDYSDPATEKPPLLIIAHGGPTAATSRNLNMELQYFSSRGFAVADVNYRGSTGYGREFRLSLYRNWGIYDRDDCVNCAESLAGNKNDKRKDKPLIDIKRVISRGKSAGGYLTMVLATFTSLLKAGASYAGISDLVFIRDETDKLEAYYAISLVTDKNNPVKEFEIRAPINTIDLLDCPMIFFQGQLDGIVPPRQAEMMVDALQEKGKPAQIELFADEAHHFLKAKNIRKCLREELQFYARNLGFELPDES
ncbi:MAG: S9 family peptidase, partial [bacterium]|nr:S9 family peptidase [bacterium]